MRRHHPYPVFQARGCWVCIPVLQHRLAGYMPHVMITNRQPRYGRFECGVKGRTPFEALTRAKKLVEGN